MIEQFIDWKPNRKSSALIESVNVVLDEYKRQGYHLTLRQLYYQLVSRDILPNNLKSYSMLGNVVSQGRLAGLIDWTMIEDRVRIPSTRQHWESPKQILEVAARGYYISRWSNQPTYIEVWSEKDAVSNILEPVCQHYDVLFMANRGYSSQSAMYDGYLRFKEAMDNGKETALLYFGDHDPSGIDMTRDIGDRLGLMVNFDGYLSVDDRIPFENVERLALNLDQVKEYRPPENPAKMTDSRFENYRADFGTKSWELDALEPRVLASLLETAIVSYIDQDRWNECVAMEDQQRQKIVSLIETFDEG